MSIMGREFFSEFISLAIDFMERGGEIDL